MLTFEQFVETEFEILDADGWARYLPKTAQEREHDQMCGGCEGCMASIRVFSKSQQVTLYRKYLQKEDPTNPQLAHVLDAGSFDHRKYGFVDETQCRKCGETADRFPHC